MLSHLNIRDWFTRPHPPKGESSKKGENLVNIELGQ
jgi:hypothetical protein